MVEAVFRRVVSGGVEGGGQEEGARALVRLQTGHRKSGNPNMSWILPWTSSQSDALVRALNLFYKAPTRATDTGLPS